MATPKLKKLNISDIHLSGIHLDLLETQGKGLTGHIGDVFLDLSDDSAWLGGKGESWERGPYYIDGLIPLAYLVNDKALIALANKWVDSILSTQEDGGFFGPKSNLDWWPRAVVLKSLASYYLATNDPRIPKFTEKYLDYMDKHIALFPFDFWGYARGMEGKELLDLLYKDSNHIFVDSLIQQWKVNTLDWKKLFQDFPYRYPTTRYLNKQIFNLFRPFVVFFDQLAKRRIRPKSKTKEAIKKSREQKVTKTYLQTHGVNIAMAFKYLAYFEGSEHPTDDAVFEALNSVLKYHGNALCLFSSDEHLNGTSPEQGIELCVVVEMMYSMSEVMRVTGSMKAADYLEYYAYNALLTTITPDFCAHQYLQQVNQIECDVKKHSFYDAGKHATTFGIAPNFGCCAANMHQGWPKMMASAVMHTSDSIVVFLYISGKYHIDFEDGHVDLSIQTNYPFEDHVVIQCLEATGSSPKKWTFRIPYRSHTSIQYLEKVVEIDGLESYSFLAVSAGEEIELSFAFSVQTIFNPDASFSVRRGPLLFALPIDSQEVKLNGPVPYHDRSFLPIKESHSFPLLKNNQVEIVNYTCQVDKNQFYHNHIHMVVKGLNTLTKQLEPITLIPYGQTILRIAQFISNR